LRFCGAVLTILFIGGGRLAFVALGYFGFAGNPGDELAFLFFF